MKIKYNKTHSSQQFGGYSTINLIPRLHYHNHSNKPSIAIAWLGLSIFINFN